MSTYYCSKDGDTLDWICWQYYAYEVSLGAAAIETDARILADVPMRENSFLFNPQTDQNIRSAVERVLEANPGLAAYPLKLPANVTIVLPDLTEQFVDNDVVKLWD
ncbi:hypothetical protein AB835_03835 [Candidatus Endobugula sertula]|uniref:Phage tail protein n=1 Tax=Candidatus Endobugula sertula TaxID=62101 RepID=A0A1D2QS79_9GAMM|nr:hypothetical protein AB835_03835 [Candidatus Endobugula sertula]